MSTPLEAVIAGEDASIYGYGVVAGQTEGAARRRAATALSTHRRWRNHWANLADGSAEAAGASVAYELPEVNTPAAAAALAAVMENRLVAVYADFATYVEGNDRDDAVRAAQQCAARAVRWGAGSQAFPT